MGELCRKADGAHPALEGWKSVNNNDFVPINVIMQDGGSLATRQHMAWHFRGLEEMSKAWTGNFKDGHLYTAGGCYRALMPAESNKMPREPERIVL